MAHRAGSEPGSVVLAVPTERVAGLHHVGKVEFSPIVAGRSDAECAY
jgi:hypothetical protein